VVRRAEDLPVKLYGESLDFTARAFTGPDYGRIYDADLVATVQRFAGTGSHWKVPGQIDWSNMSYNPWVDVTKETTTLYASDRDVFLFLVDDTRPIEVGKLANGDPDLIFRGFYAWNSEVGARSMGIVSISVQLGPTISVQTGPVPAVALDGHARFLMRQLSLPVSMMSQ
jgi:hypothetical protein